MIFSFKIIKSGRIKETQIKTCKFTGKLVFTSSPGLKLQMTDSLDLQQPVPPCNGGQTGMWTYMTCVPGAPGAPGRDGTKGDLGSPGKNVTQGRRGADGKKGSKGRPGIQGSPGQKGQRGDKGDSGTPRRASHMNWKECAWKKRDENNTGLIYVSE